MITFANQGDSGPTYSSLSVERTSWRGGGSGIAVRVRSSGDLISNSVYLSHASALALATEIQAMCPERRKAERRKA